jgi:hypothetical protein
MTELEYQEWRQPYREAVLETDDERISDRIKVAQNAIVVRMLTMPITAETLPEALKLESALRNLTTLKKQRTKAGTRKVPSARPSQFEAQAD